MQNYNWQIYASLRGDEELCGMSQQLTRSSVHGSAVEQLYQLTTVVGPQHFWETHQFVTQFVGHMSEEATLFHTTV